MAFPYIFEANFETGDNSEWSSETDTVGQLDFASYKELSRFPFSTAAPFRGAFAMRAVLSGGTADAFVLQNDINIAAAARRFFRFLIWFSPDFTGTADDTFNLFECQDTGNVVEVAFGARVVAATNVINLGIGGTGSPVQPTSFSTLEIERGRWYAIELDITLDNAGSNDGTIDLFITKEDDTAATVIAATQVASLDQGVVTHGVLGPQNHLATTTGTILFDQFIMDDARIFPISDRFSQTINMTKSGHVFVGRGEIENITLLSGDNTADNVLTVFDTNTANVTDETNVKVELKNTATSEVVDPAGVPVVFTRGAFVELSGDTPRAVVKLKKVHAYGSPASIRREGRSQR